MVNLVNNTSGSTEEDSSNNDNGKLGSVPLKRTAGRKTMVRSDLFRSVGKKE